MKPQVTSTAVDSTSLPEVHATVSTRHPNIWRRLFAFAGPAYLVSVGYMDPGNWATDLEGGARFGYQLVWVLVLSNLMAILLQTLSARLGIVTQRDLAQACRESYPKLVSNALWLLCEIAIAACDLAEVLGAAIGLNLLFHIDLMTGVLLTAADTLLVLWFTKLGIRVVEGFILALVTVITGCFLIELWFVHPSFTATMAGLIPRLNDESLYIAIGMLGATVMPHNLYLHSSLVQTRSIARDVGAKRAACKFNLVDSAIALNGAMIVNAAILMLSAAVFFQHGVVVTEIQQAHQLLSPLTGSAVASVLFAVALICSGQSSTLTGTLAGQIVMEGFLNLRIRPWLRRFLTRSLAIIPAAATIYYAGEHGTYDLLILSQVILSLQLPFAVLPLVQFTGDRKRMGEFVSPVWVRVLAWATTIVIIGLNMRLVGLQLSKWLESAGAWRLWLILGAVPVLAVLGLLLLWMALEPVLPERLRKLGRGQVELPARIRTALRTPLYRSILLALDHSERDNDALSHTLALARSQGAAVHIVHVEEGVTSQVYGEMASTAEIESGRDYFEGILEAFRERGVEVQLHVLHSDDPAGAIIRHARELNPDLVVMGAHGHRGVKDVVLGTTINAVRHELDLPILLVRQQPEANPPL